MTATILGQKITQVREMTAKEKEEEGWSDWPGKVLVIELENGTKLFPSRDGEGNGPGVMFARHKNKPHYVGFDGRLS